MAAPTRAAAVEAAAATGIAPASGGGRSSFMLVTRVGPTTKVAPVAGAEAVALATVPVFEAPATAKAYPAGAAATAAEAAARPATFRSAALGRTGRR